MNMRFAAAALGFAFVCLSGAAEARPYFGYDGRHYGEFAAAPNFGRPEKKVVKGGGNRKGLTPAALALLERIESTFGPVNVISGYRPGATIAGTGRISRHASGNAIDFDAGSRKTAIVTWLIANHHTGGTMTYSDMSHIHADIGPHFVSIAPGSVKGDVRAAARVLRDKNKGAEPVRVASNYKSSEPAPVASSSDGTKSAQSAGASSAAAGDKSTEPVQVSARSGSEGSSKPARRDYNRAVRHDSYERYAEMKDAYAGSDRAESVRYGGNRYSGNGNYNNGYAAVYQFQ
jgi:hypothetical protein